MSMKGRTWQSEKYRYGFNGKENDGDIGEEISDFDARLLNKKNGRWMAIDPKAGKYPSMSPYNFVENMPIWAIDPDGEEKIVISGGEYEGRYASNFIDPALKQAIDYKRNAKNEQVTWIIANTGGYSDNDIKKFQAKAQRYGVTVILINSADELTTYINKKTTKLAEGLGDSNGSPDASDGVRTIVSESRAKDKITAMAIFSHGVVDDGKGISLGYHSPKQTQLEVNKQKVSEYNGGAFNGAACLIDVYACNVGTPTDDNHRGNPNTSLGAFMAKQTKTSVLAYWGKTEYVNINVGRSLSEKIDSKILGFSPYGSKNLPTGGAKNQESGVPQRPPSEKIIFGAKRD